MAASGLSRAARLILATAVVLPSLVVLSAKAEAAGAQTASSVLTAAKSAIGKQTSVHLEVTSSSGSASAEEKLKADLGKTSGIETISEGTETVVIKVTPTDAYLSGDSSGLTKILGLTSAEAKKVGSDWLTLKAGTSQYKTLATSVTVSSVGSVLPPAKGTHLYAPAPPTKKFYTLKWSAGVSQFAHPLGCWRHPARPRDHDGFGSGQADSVSLQVGRARPGERAPRGVDHPLVQDLRLSLPPDRRRVPLPPPNSRTPLARPKSLAA
jgi:hypothetical protein